MKGSIERKVIAVLTVCCLLFIGMPVFAGGIVKLNAADLKDGILDLSLKSWIGTTIQIPKEISDITIKGSLSTTYSGLNIVAEDRMTPLNLTIQDLKIKGGGIDIARTSASSNLHLLGANTIINTGNNAAICVQGGKTLTINAKDTNQSLKAVGGNGGGAGIGANKLMDSGTGNIIIKGGTITAIGKGGASGIGQGEETHGAQDGNISILGGVIKAIGGENAAGIGGSKNSGIGDILINSATITAVGGNGGPGIGAGTKGGGDITITGGAYITATGAGGGAGIGGSIQGEANVKDILIDGAIIEAYGSDIGGAGIGGGNAASFRRITIRQSDTKVPTIIKKAIGGKEAAGIGVGRTSNIMDSLVEISGGTICEATGGNQGAGIGGGSQRAVDIVIAGTAVIEKAQGGNQAAGIGSGPLGSQETITITGGVIKSTIGGDYGAGIGGGDSRSQKITITDGIIERTQGGIDAAGIGGGRGGKETLPINISGGKIYAIGGKSSDSSRGPINDIGSGRGNSEKEEENGIVKITNADVFVDGNTIRGISPDSTSKEVVFTLYDNKASNELCDKNKVALRAIDDEVSKKLIMDGEYDVKAGSKIYARIELEGVTSSNINIDEVFHKYWFQYDTDEGIPMIGHPVTTSAGWKIDLEPDMIHQDVLGHDVVDSYKLKKIEMDIEFQPGDVESSGVMISGFNDDISGITPFAMSCITFEIPKITNPKFKSLEKVNVTMSLDGDMEFNVSKWQVGVFEKVGNTTRYEYKKNLTDELKVKVSRSGKNLMMDYPSSLLDPGKYKIAVYVDTKYFTYIHKPDLASYKEIYVKEGRKLNIRMDYNIDMKVLTIQKIRIPGVVTPISVRQVVVTENKIGHTSLAIPYKDITKIY